ncbi:Inositol 2-dehydrogenase [Pirellula sp. SH-Sr6A]|uniref:Gfo/Idh/MocA family protein n=1 Tax=Pirellula sp. SH-Sr6A TaxID=1632865 RepID=UPI00078CA503|nr:Gfo/Idh/MocA family oxidoreductase [Pirellula sp. SH-Sr6A]AMV35513.1 Inositol 2-dehydrogenase [Pirellula sp. SH-Sr6A]
MDRRHFLAGAAAGSIALAQHSETLANLLDNKNKRVGLIGTGWYGKCDLFRLMQVAPVDVVSLCDVDSKMLSEASEMVTQKQKGTAPRTFSDYRKMLAEKDLDIVLIATPDHWHALPTIEALKTGADVYVQKPISVDIVEGEAMLAAARKYNRVVQVGTQRRSTPHLMEAKRDIVDAGLLGKVSHAEVYCYYHMRAKENPPDEMPPANLDYEMWTGPAPMRPYNNLCHPRRWRAFKEYGNGIVGDMCIHMLDLVRWQLGLGWPTRVSSQGGIFVDKNSKANIPDTQTATFEFPELNVVWTHRTWGDAPDPEYPWGATLYGEKGTLKMSVQKFDFIPRDRRQKPVHRDVVMELDKYPEDRTEKDLEQHVAPAIRVHMLDFLKSIQERSKPVADIEQGHISTAACILANMSLELGRSLAWDPSQGKIVGDDAANQMLRRAYRAPWVHPEVGTV